MSSIGKPLRVVERPKPEPVQRPIEVPDWPTRKEDEPIRVPDWPTPVKEPAEVDVA